MIDFSELSVILTSKRVNRTRLPDGTGVILDIAGLHVMSLAGCSLLGRFR